MFFLRDLGYIPGDGKGAGGLDSAMFSHLKRNWSAISVNAPLSSIQQKSDDKNASTEEKPYYYAEYLKKNSSTSVPSSSSDQPIAGVRNVRLSLYKASYPIFLVYIF